MISKKLLTEIKIYEDDFTLTQIQKETRIKIVKDYSTIFEIINRFNNELSEFVLSCDELIKLTDNKFFINERLDYTKIAIKGYILESKVCTLLNSKNIDDFTIKELENFSYAYEQKTNTDLTTFRKALILYKNVCHLLNTSEKITELIKSVLSETIKFDIDKKADNYKEINHLLASNVIDKTTYKYLNDLINYLYYQTNNGLLLPLE